MGTLDIVIYAAIAAFLVYRLWSVLGQREEGGDMPARRPPPPPMVGKRQDDNVVMLEGRARPAQPSALTRAGNAPTSLAGALDQIKAADETFEEKSFLEGAKKAFDGIVAAFSRGDIASVSRFLSPGVEQLFGAAVRDREEKGQTLEHRTDRFVSADIVAASLDGSMVSLSVEFVTHQVNILRDKNGTILDGTPGKAEEVRDVWVFIRDVKSSNPNWLLFETRS